MQTNLRVAVDEIAQHHSIIGHRFGTLQSEATDPGDMYQWSRAVTDMIQAMDDHLENERLHAGCLDFIMTLVRRSTYLSRPLLRLSIRYKATLSYCNGRVNPIRMRCTQLHWFCCEI